MVAGNFIWLLKDKAAEGRPRIWLLGPLKERIDTIHGGESQLLFLMLINRYLDRQS